MTAIFKNRLRNVEFNNEKPQTNSSGAFIPAEKEGTANQILENKDSKFKLRVTDTFTLTYGGYDFISGVDRGPGQCKVEIKREPGRGLIHVRIFEPPKDTGSISVTNYIEHLATQIYWGFLRGFDVERITWTTHYEVDGSMVREPFDLRNTLYWNGTQFLYSKPDPKPMRGSFLSRLMGRPDEIKNILESPDQGLSGLAVWNEKGAT